ncbi:hypothetical protein RintRC_3894 [Richelia intracellularis]|nr:hypothetical protein RintRC_3894 [Richelia intracellularis]
MVEKKWNSALSEGNHSFVWEYGEDVLALHKCGMISLNSQRFLNDFKL